MKKYISVIAVLFAVGITGCKKDYLSLENNPNQPSVTTPQLLLPSAEATAANIYMSNYPHYGVWGGFWTTSGNYVPNAELNQYQITTSTGTAAWDNLYLNLSNWHALMAVSTTPDAANYMAIAKIMWAFDFQQLVDNFNNVPYSQAFDPKILAPAYDNGVDVYHDLGKQLDQAIALINNNPNATVPTTDIISFGSPNEGMKGWKKFANTLKLRLAIRVYKKLGVSDPLVTDLASTASEGYLDVDASLNPGFTQSNSGSGVSQQNPFFDTYGNNVTGNATFGNVYYRANAYAVSFYHVTNDPRVTAYYTPASSPPPGTPADGVHGNIFGDINNNLPNPNTSAIGPGLLVSPAQNAVLFSAFESDFLQAEALLPGGILSSTTTFTSAQAAYNAGITASFVDVGLTAAQAQAYYGQAIANVGWTSSNPLTAILVQKWAAMNGWFNLEAYNEYRRTGIPALPTSIDPSAIGHNLPTRILYPTRELSTNAANVGKQGTINPLTSKIFWAQ
jgi:hypothetical protein